MTRPSLARRAARPDFAAALFVSLLPLAYFLPAARGQLYLAPDDGVIFNVPLRAAAARLLSEGHLPLWNPYLFGGMPLHAAAQAGLLFPLNWFYFFFDAPLATNLMSLSAYVLAALGAYLFARRGGASVAGSVLTSVVYQSCGFLVAQVGHVNVVQTAALLPWLLWAVDRYGAGGGRGDGLLVAALVMLQAFTGHQQTFAYSLLLASAYALVSARASQRPARNFYLWSLALLAVGVSLAAVQILPTYELMRNSLRSASSFDFFTSFSLPPRFLLAFFAPYVTGGGDGRLFRAPYTGEPFYGEFIGYVGVVTIALAIVAFVLKRDARTKFWACVAVVCLALALGRNWPFKLYGVVYYVPVLNLFRVPARHLMEIDLALAVLAGRGLTALWEARGGRRARKAALICGAGVLLVTCLVVTVGRPAEFRLGREAPVSLLRAPELFVPVVFALLSAWAVWLYARRPRAANAVLLIFVAAVDLCVWGQSSGWRLSSPTPESQLWREPPPLGLVKRRQQATGGGQFRILTVPHAFDPSREVTKPPTPAAALWLQPDVYMMHGVENAAGYDGFGLARFSRLAGDMTVWGELPDPERSLRGGGRELDLLNVRYVLAEREGVAAPKAAGAAATRPASHLLAGERFAEEDLGASGLEAGERLSFVTPPTEVSRVALLTNLSWATNVHDGAKVGVVRLTGEDGRAFELDLLAGRHTSEWAYDRPDIRPRVRHARANVGRSFAVEDAQAKYEGHAYVTALELPEKVKVTGVEVEAARAAQAPELSLSVLRVSLVDGESVVPLQREWSSRNAAAAVGVGTPTQSQGARWERLGEADGVVVYENLRALPRAWLAGEARVLKEDEILGAIRTGRLPSGETWEPGRTALVEAAPELSLSGEAGSAEVLRHEPNRVEVRTSSPAPSVLVLSENHYPGWRASVDGQAVETMRVNYNLRGVALPAGAHEVTFAYRPKSVLLGLLVSLAAAALLALWRLRLLPEEKARRLFSRAAAKN